MKSIEVNISGRMYPIKVTVDEEEQVRTAVRGINEMVTDFQNTYRNKDKQDCLSMALLTYALNSVKSEIDKAEVDKIAQKTQSIQQILSAV